MSCAGSSRCFLRKSGTAGTPPPPRATQLRQDITAILDGKAGALSLYTENGWQGTVLCTELPGAEDAGDAAVLKRCWQTAKPDAALPADSRLELVCWDPAHREPEGTAPGGGIILSGTIWNIRRAALDIFSGKIILNEQCRSVCGRSGIAFSWRVVEKTAAEIKRIRILYNLLFLFAICHIVCKCRAQCPG